MMRMSSTGCSDSARCSATPGVYGAKTTAPRSRRLFITIECTRGWLLLPSPSVSLSCSVFLVVRRVSMISCTMSVDTQVTTFSLMSIAGA